MATLIVASNRDPASVNIAEQLLRNYGFNEIPAAGGTTRLYRSGEVFLAYFDVESIFNEDADKLIQAEAIIFASKHSSESGEPTLSVHATGNPSSMAPFGGKPKTLAWAHPQRMRAALMALQSAVSELGINCSVTLEATHHGPTELTAPTLFVEIGGTEGMWRNRLAGMAAASAIWEAATNPAPGTSAVGFGGGHYPKKHTDIAMRGEFAVGHVLSKYFFGDFDPEVAKAAFRKTHGSCRVAVVDWKGLKGSDRSRLTEVLSSEDIDVIRV